VIIQAVQLKSLIQDISTAAGVTRDDSAILADALVAADLAGTGTHGVSRLGIYVRRIRAGVIAPKAELSITRKRAATLTIDANNGLGQVQAMKALEMLYPMAKTAGIASAVIRNSQHFGALSYYCNHAAERNMILLAMTSCEPAMSPEGGYGPFFGTNPIAASFPTGKGFAVKIDLSTSIIARGKIIAAQKSGEKIPLGWALSPEGDPTDDPNRALLGTVLTMAGHKGYALAMMVECFSSVLSGAAIGSEIGSMYKDMNRKQDVGHFLCLLDIDAFMDVSEFTARMDRTIDALKSMRKRPGIEEILIPGERSQRTTQKNLRDGIKLPPAVVEELRQMCSELGVKFSM
jgi:LDH2 family malate/lactate/ureidoglycolate dehydrogenase